MRKLATVVAAAAVLALPASATAKTIRQEGGFVGDPTSRVSLQVQTKGGDPRAVTDFKARNVQTRCQGKPSRIDFTVLSRVRVGDNNGFKVRLSDGDGGILRISGRVENNGRRVVGNLKTNEFKSSNGKLCKTPKQRFKTSK